MTQGSAKPGRANSLPSPPTPFIGRTEELRELSELLDDPSCRLITIVGPGGVGKTRLAQRVAAAQPHATFVDLQPVDTVEFLIAAIADTFDVTLSGQENPVVQLCHALQRRELLLILDNFEHLLPTDGADLLPTLLDAAPALTLLVTSREALNLQEERRYPIGGMPVPTDQSDDIAAYDAVQLFVNRATHVRPDFSLDDERAGVVRICRLVGGMPLALELAASWTRTVSCTAIADEIQHNVEFLETNLRNVPDRHRSIRAVFRHSWDLLDERERDIFKRLSVFRGGFDRDAAEAVAGASLPILSALHDKSLVQRDTDGRYRIHELVRQCAEERLSASSETAKRTYDLHSAYFTTFLHTRAEDIESWNQRTVIRAIATDLDNVRAAIQHAIADRKIERLRKALYTYSQFCEFQGRFQESVDVLESAIGALEMRPAGQERDASLALFWTMKGFSLIRLGRFEAARNAFTHAHTLYDEWSLSPPASRFGTDPLCGLALLATTLGDYDKAVRLAERARRYAGERNDTGNLQVALYVLTDAVLSQGRYDAARTYAHEAYTVTNAANNRWMLAYVLTLMGNVARAAGDYEEARRRYRAGYEMKQEFDDPEGMAAALNHMARTAVLQGDYQDAEQLYRRSLAMYEDMADRGGLATSLHGLGDTARALGDLAGARRQFQRALDIAIDIEWTPLVVALLVSIGEWLLASGQRERGLAVTAFARRQPAAEHQTKVRAQQVLDDHADETQQDAAFATAEQMDLATLTATLQADLAAWEPAPRPSHDRSTKVSPSEQPLIEALTPRELDVLALLADGMTNKEIAETLVISTGTVKWYTSQIYGKLGVSNRTQAAAAAHDLDLLS